MVKLSRTSLGLCALAGLSAAAGAEALAGLAVAGDAALGFLAACLDGFLLRGSASPATLGTRAGAAAAPTAADAAAAVSVRGLTDLGTRLVATILAISTPIDINGLY